MTFNDIPINPFGDASTAFHFFPSESHKKAVHRILTGLGSRCGLVMLTGEIGTGKTTLCRHIQALHNDRFLFAELGNPFLTPVEQIHHFCQEFGLPGMDSPKAGMKMLTDYFTEQLEKGKIPVLIFDESHLLTHSHFGQIQVFSNLRKNDVPLVQMLLVGQLELLDRLREPGLEALNQRIGIRCELDPLSLDDAQEYVQFKLADKKTGKEVSFSRSAVQEIWKLSGGVPRLINHACSHLLDTVLFSGHSTVSAKMVQELAAKEMYKGLFTVRSEPIKPKRKPLPVRKIVVAAMVVLLLLLAATDNPVRNTGLSLLRSYVAETVTEASEAESPVETAASSQKPKAVEENRVVEPAKTVVQTPVVAEKAAEKKIEKPSVIAVQAAPVTETPVPQPTAEKPITAPVVSQTAPVVAEAHVAPTPPPPPASSEEEEYIDGSLHPVVGTVIVEAVVYTPEPEGRLAVINEKILHEGDRLGKLTLKEIRENSLVFNYQGQLYSVPIDN